MSKREVIRVGAAIAAVLTASCVPASAAGFALTPAGYVDCSKIDVREGAFTAAGVPVKGWAGSAGTAAGR